MIQQELIQLIQLAGMDMYQAEDYTILIMTSLIKYQHLVAIILVELLVMNHLHLKITLTLRLCHWILILQEQAIKFGQQLHNQQK